MKRILVLLLVLAMMVPMCTALAEAEPETITLWTFQELHIEFYKAMAEKWNEENPDKPINLETLALSDADIYSNLQVALQSGTGAPDIVDIEINKYQNYLKGDIQLLPLNDIVEPELDNIVQARVNVYAKDGNYYGICFHVGAEVMYYNMEIMDEAGVDPATIKTWADFYEAGKTVVEKTGKPMTTIETGDSWTEWPMFSQADSDFFDADGNVTLDNDTNVEICEYLQKLLQDGIAIVSPGGYHHTEEYYGFMNQGGAACIWMPMWYMGRFTDYMPDLKGKMKIYPAPAWTEGGDRSAVMGGTGTSITNQAKNPELCKEFLAYCKLSNEGCKMIWTMLGFDPIRIETWSDPIMQEPNKYTEYFDQPVFDVLLEVKDEFNDIHMTELSPTMENLLETEGWARMFVNFEDCRTVLTEIADMVRAEM